MCEFCKHSTDYSADEAQFFNEVAKSPIMINDVEAALLVLSGNWSDWTNGPILDVEFLGYEYNPVLAEIMQPINYCPICGKQLSVGRILPCRRHLELVVANHAFRAAIVAAEVCDNAEIFVSHF